MNTVISASTRDNPLYHSLMKGRAIPLKDNNNTGTTPEGKRASDSMPMQRAQTVGTAGHDLLSSIYGE